MTEKNLWSEVKKQIECNCTKSIKYEKCPMKIRLDSYDDDLPFNKIFCFLYLNIIVESVFQIKDKYHPQIVIQSVNVKNMSMNINTNSIYLIF